MSKYKLVALDLDGTLLNENKKIGDEDRQYLKLLAKNNYHVVLISGRPTAGMLDLVEELELSSVNTVFASFNGGKVSCTTTKKELFSKKLTTEQIIKVREFARTKGFVTVNYLDDKYFVDKDDSNFATVEGFYTNLEYIEVPKLPENFVDNKCLVVGTKEMVAEHLDSFIEHLDDLSVATSAPYYIEINPKNVHKGTGLAQISKILDIKPEEMIAFGDGWNDKEMLDFVGHGVLMNNASDALKEHFSIINEYTNTENGISKYLKENKIFNL